MTSYPIWATPSQLGTYPEGTSLTENQIVLAFGDTANATVMATLLNGALPPGISWRQVGYEITLSGFLRSVTQTENYNFTFRLSNGVNIADRTFYLSVNNVQLTSFAWETSSSLPLVVVYLPQAYEAVIQAVTDPLAPVTYTLLAPQLLSQGVTLDSSSGELHVDYTWKPTTAYVESRDYVITPSGLYECIISGVSGSSVPPQSVGPFIDSDYPEWQPLRFYTVNSVVTNDLGKVYLCVSQGFSGVPGPTGTGSSISDGSVVWSYQDQSPVWDNIASNTIVDQVLSVVADSGTQSLADQFLIQLVSTPYEPLWITPAGALPDAFTEQSYSFQLEAVDPDQNALTWSSTNLPSWLQLNIVGQLSGIAPLVEQNTPYTFDVTIDDGDTSVTQTFTITVVENVVEFAWVTESDLGTQPDGIMSSIKLRATTTRAGAFVNYGLSGGQLPVGLILNTQSGAIEGFVEFHAQAKTYYWEVWASDGVENLIRAFTLQVIPKQLGHYWTLQIPLWGPVKDDWQVQNSESVVSSDNLYLPDVAGYGRTTQPAVTIISGIQGISAQDLRMVIQNYLHNFVVQMQDLIFLPTANPLTQVLSVRVQDSDTVKLWTRNTAYTKGERVSNTAGERYVALNTGVSSVQSPQGRGSQIFDGSMVWAWDSVANNRSANRSPLPWYPYHTYEQGATVFNQGKLYQVITSGISGGSNGPLGSQEQITDGSVVWTPINETSPFNYGNLFWPDNLFNIRQSLISQVGWSTGQGTGITADVIVNFNGSVTQVNITNPGSGYYAAPQAELLGTGSGAQLQFKLGIVGVDIQNGGVGWSLGQQFELDLGSGTPAVLEIDAVSVAGAVQSIAVIESGIFDQIPSNILSLGSQGLVLTVRLQSGVISCDVISGGTGYTVNQTQLVVQGREYSPDLQTFVDYPGVRIPLAYVNTSWAQTTDVASIFNPFASEVIDVRAITATLQGITWQGSSRFDGDTCTWDSDSTRLVDANPATALEWDDNLTTWDQGLTVWDNPQIVWPQYSNTVFDDDQTIWDYYRTIFDQANPLTTSRYGRTWVWWMGQPWRGAK